MSGLPDRPDLDQLRRRARELHRAAIGGDADAVRRLSAVSDRVTLSAAQSALAREYGFPSWPRLKAEVERHRAADPLIEGQYADRPHLRPILDAVLAALAALGEVTVQPRKTCVSLVSPQRTFAMVRATTRNRVDVGLRLADVAPTGRLLTAKNLGNFPVRLGLTGPEDVDDEAVGWLRQAYEENNTSTVKRPAVRSTAKATVLAVRIDGVDLPGISCHPEGDGTTHRAVHVGLCSREKERPGLTVPDRPWRAVEPVPGDAASARWNFDITVRPAADGGLDFGGPFVQGDRTDRHLKLAWGDAPGDGTLRLFRAAKLRLAEVDEDVVTAATRSGHRLVARIRLTDAKGQPICARLRPPDIAWSAEADG